MSVDVELQEQLKSISNSSYADFTSGLLPTVGRERIIGVPIPVLRKIARGMTERDGLEFMSSLPHTYHEENLIHGFLIEKEGDFDRCVLALDSFLPLVDNWSVCDSTSPKILAKNKARLLEVVGRWIHSAEEYTVRFAIVTLMRHFLDDDFDEAIPRIVADACSEKYYVNMAVAWYFATALSKQYDRVKCYLEDGLLPSWVHAKTIQKACESRRLTAEQKAYLRSLK